MKRVVRYKSIDPYYSDVVQAYIGSSAEEIDNIQYETEKFMSREHSNIGNIYKSEVIIDECQLTMIKL